jgi:cytochrome c oxidase subunit 3
MVLGTIFIAGQIWEWFTLMDEGLIAEGAYGSTFYVITGFHGAHVIAGLCMLAVVYLRANWNDFVDVIWVFVFLTLYVSPKL